MCVILFLIQDWSLSFTDFSPLFGDQGVRPNPLGAVLTEPFFTEGSLLQRLDRANDRRANLLPRWSVQLIVQGWFKKVLS